MGIRLTVSLLVTTCACSARLGDPGAHDQADAPVTHPDAKTPDGPTVLGAWGTPTSIPGANSSANNEDDLTLDSTGTELIYAVQPAAGGAKDLYVMTRPTRNDPWGAPTQISGGLDTAGNEESPRLSANNLDLYFGRDGDIYKTSRASVGATWGPAAVVSGSGNTASYEKWLAVCGTNHFMVSRDNGVSQDLYEGTLGSVGTAVAELNSTSNEISTFLSPDCLTVYFASNRGGQTALWTSTRTSMASAWDAPTPVAAPFDSGTDNEDGWISTDQRIFAFAGVRNGAATKDLYISTR